RSVPFSVANPEHLARGDDRRRLSSGRPTPVRRLVEHLPADVVLSTEDLHATNAARSGGKDLSWRTREYFAPALPSDWDGDPEIAIRDFEAQVAWPWRASAR